MTTPNDAAGVLAEALQLPPRVAVGKNGAYWRDYGDAYSMCPVSDDNDPIEVVAVYVLQPAGSEFDPGYIAVTIEVVGPRLTAPPTNTGGQP